jgi:hypothetical protein
LTVASPLSFGRPPELSGFTLAPMKALNSGYLVALALCLAAFLPSAHAAVLASSSLQTCVQNSSTSVHCKQMLVLTVTVGNGESLVTQELDFQVACVGRYAAPTGLCTHQQLSPAQLTHHALPLPVAVPQGPAPAPATTRPIPPAPAATWPTP